MSKTTYRFTYGSNGKYVGQDFNGGYTMVVAPDWNTAVRLWSAVHNKFDAYPMPYSELYTDHHLEVKNWTDVEFDEHFYPCRDIICYTERIEHSD